MSAGGYHHHLGTNTWAIGARAPTKGDARLLEWELVLPASEAVEAALASLRANGFESQSNQTIDPWGTALRLTAAA
jgi:catechol 2,3-dioxygenase